MRTAWVLSMSCACLLGERVAVTAGDPPAAVPQAGTARIVGRVPVVPRKSPSAVKDYGPPPAFKV